MAGVWKRAAADPSPPPAAPDLLTGAAGFNARRRRRTTTRQRRPGRNPPSLLFSSLPRPRPPLATTPDTVLDLNSPTFDLDQPLEGLRFLLQKELRNSDVGSLGRIVLPKKEAEGHLPVLTAREGISLPMYDMETSEIWPFKYRFWPNNKSRMYILENTGEFVRTHGLQLGDFIMLYKDEIKDRYIIRAKKNGYQEQPLAPIDDGIFDSIMPDIAVNSARYSDLFLPLADGMNMAFGLNYAFSEDFPSTFPDERMGSSSAASESLSRCGQIGNLSLDDFF